MHGGERTVGKQFVEYSQRVAVDEDGVVEAAPGEPGRSIASVLERQLDPQKVAVLVRCGRADEEQTFAAAHFNFERRFAIEQTVRVPGSRKVVELAVMRARSRAGSSLRSGRRAIKRSPQAVGWPALVTLVRFCVGDTRVFGMRDDPI